MIEKSLEDAEAVATGTTKPVEEAKKIIFDTIAVATPAKDQGQQDKEKPIWDCSACYEGEPNLLGAVDNFE